MIVKSMADHSRIQPKGIHSDKAEEAVELLSLWYISVFPDPLGLTSRFLQVELKLPPQLYTDMRYRYDVAER